MSRLLVFMILAVVLVLPEMVVAQETRALTVGEGSTMTISGTSNKSDWSVEPEEFSGTFSVNGRGAALSVEAAHFVVVAGAIRSERGVIMNRLMQGALKVTANPEIAYAMTEVLSSEAVEGGVQVLTHGTLSIAGAENPVEMVVTAVEDAVGVRFSGSLEIDMTEWAMKPPTAMFGALHTGKVVTVAFEILGVPEG
jgi:YceI-like protein